MKNERADPHDFLSRPGGFFLYAGLISPHFNNLSLVQIMELLNKNRLSLIKAGDITKNVLKSRDIVTNSGLFDQAVKKMDK